MAPLSDRGGPALLDPSAGPKLSSREFQQISEMARSVFGLELRQGKEELVSARLGKHVRRGGFRSFSEYLDHVRGDRSGASMLALIDALATNHTAFLRERAHFDLLGREILPKLAREAGTIRIWSAACSTGEEPYTLACVALDALGAAAAGRVKILATDISTKALDQARRAVYPEDRCAELPRAWLDRWFTRTSLEGRAGWKARPEVASMIEFGRVNLLEPVTRPGRFHAIFCRNVMIYFSPSTQEGVVRRLGALLEPGGHLFVGHAESLTGIAHGLKFVRAAVYQAPGGKP